MTYLAITIRKKAGHKKTFIHFNFASRNMATIDTATLPLWL